MDQHPVPQNISSYEFRLVGDMTLKQFFQLAGGIVMALIFYRVPLPGILKWPLIFISVLGGILLAFVPLQGRPFSQWIMAFFKAVYSPTHYFWKSDPTTSSSSTSSSTATEPQPTTPSSPLDNIENQLFSKFTDLFNSVTHLSFNRTPTAPPPGGPTPIAPPVAEPPAPLPITPVATPPPLPAPPLVSEQPTVAPIPAKPADLNPFAAVGLTPTATYQPKTATPAISSQQAASALLIPTQPNILAGIVSDAASQPVEGAIMEIAEKTSGLPVRALRSNKLGQFQIATPLPNNEYVITTEKEGVIFDPVSVTTNGQVIPPIEIKARAA